MARSGFSHHLPELGTAAGEILGRTEAFIYTIADAVVSSAADPVAIVEESKQKSDWFSGITDVMETVLKVGDLFLIKEIVQFSLHKT